MESWAIWTIAGVVMILLEFILPGAVIVFLGIAAVIVGLGVYFSLITSIVSAFLAWFMISIFLMVFLRSLFTKYFEGNTLIQNVDEDLDILDSMVEVTEDVLAYKEGRVKFRGSTWNARSDQDLSTGHKAIIIGRDGNTLIIKSL